MKTQCPNCKAKFNINETSVGKQAKCPKCTQPFKIEPFVETPASPVSSPEPVKDTAPAAVHAPASTAIANPVPAAPQPKIAAPITPPIKSASLPSEEQPKTQAASKIVLSKTLFAYCWTAVRIVTGALGILGVVMAMRGGSQSTLIMIFAAADIFLIGSIAIEYMLFYKMWAAIKDNQTSISPGKAVGFLFIPVFNIYWALLMVTGFAEDYNSFILRRSIKAKSLPMSLYLIYAFALMLAETVITGPMLCILGFPLYYIRRVFEEYTAVAWILLVFLSTAGIIHFIMYIFFANKTCDAVNTLPER
jgi:predicted Zn finger-like uncharacterized protein